MPPIDFAAQLLSEEKQLVKAETDIQEGRVRLRRQQQLLSHLQTIGYETGQCERLIDLLKETLTEWERHRGLIKERIAYLRRAVDQDPPPA
jgi:hypothetical protein